jgi:hypothetical protein
MGKANGDELRGFGLILWRIIGLSVEKRTASVADCSLLRLLQLNAGRLGRKRFEIAIS